MGAQWEKDRRDTLFLMLGTALSVLPHFSHLAPWVAIGFFILFFWRLGLVLSGRWLPRDSVRWVAAIACIAAVYAQHKTLLGRDAGVTLLVLFLGLKLMEMKARRDLFVVIFLCLFLLVTSFFYSQTILNAGIVAAAVWALLAAMLTMHFKVAEVPLAQRFKMVGIMMLQALPLAAALFLLFPRLGTPLWGLPDDANAGKTGMSDVMRPGSIASLTKSTETAFRVKFDGQPLVAAQLYWRGPVLSDFDGNAWRPLGSNPIMPRTPPSLRLDPNSKTNYSITLEPQNNRWLFALDMPNIADYYSTHEGGAQLDSEAVLSAREPITNRIRYKLSSNSEYQLGSDETPVALQDFLSLPPSFNPQTLALALSWQNETPDPERLIARAMSFFNQEKFFYTTKPPLLGRNSVDDFLFKTRSGFCEHYAAAFVVLMRALDIPARVVTGYQGAELNPVDGYWLVKQADAHAWAEVWIKGKGWVRIDPTSAVAPERIEKGNVAARSSTSEEGQSKVPAWIQKLRFKTDALSNSWNQWILNYDRAAQKRLMSKIGFDFDDWLEVAGALAATLAVLIGIAALITLRPRQPKDPIERVWHRFCSTLDNKGFARAKSETSRQYLKRVASDLTEQQAQSMRQICELYNDLRYAGGATEKVKPKDVRHFEQLVGQFKV